MNATAPFNDLIPIRSHPYSVEEVLDDIASHEYGLFRRPARRVP
jgi:hypothetical protein